METNELHKKLIQLQLEAREMVNCQTIFKNPIQTIKNVLSLLG